MASVPLTDSMTEAVIARTAREALRAPPGESAALKKLELFRFTEYHEPLKRWPFVSQPVRRKVKSHGSFPPLVLVDEGGGTRDALVQRGVAGVQQAQRRGPSERIGANFSPAAKRLTVAGMRQWRVDRREKLAEIRRKKKEDSLIQRRSSLPAIVQQAETTRAALVSSTPAGSRRSSARRRGSLPASTSSSSSGSADTFTSTPPICGAEAAAAITLDFDAEEEAQRRAQFLEQFPYRSCRRGATAGGGAGDVPEPLPWEVEEPEWAATFRRRGQAAAHGNKRDALDRLRRRGIIGGRRREPESAYTEYVRKAAEEKRARILRATMLPRKKKAPSERIPAEASQPCSPTRQLERIAAVRRARRKALALKEEERKENEDRYWRYVKEGLSDDSSCDGVAGMSKAQAARITARLNPAWSENIMMRKLIAKLMAEADEGQRMAVRQAVVDYALLDPAESRRLNITLPARPCPRSIVRAPVPWHQGFLTAKQFCRHNLFITNPILLRLQIVWTKRYDTLRFVDTSQLAGYKGEPLSPLEMQRRVFEQCADARNILSKRWLHEVALVFVSLYKNWSHLIPARRGESLRQIRRFFDCVAALMARHLREMALASIKSFVDFMETYAGGNDFEGDTYRDLEYIAIPMLNLRLHSANRTVEFLPPLEQTRDIIVSCLQEIVMSTKEFWRVEKHLFPDLFSGGGGGAGGGGAALRAPRTMYLLSVDWEEDFVQTMCRRAIEIFDRNVSGPRRYLKLYDKYSLLLNGDANKDRDTFLSSRASLNDFQSKMNGYAQLKKDIMSIRNKALLNLFVLDCTDLNKGMAENCQELYDSLIKHQVMFGAPI